MIIHKSTTIQDKPFVCEVKDCDKTFTNKDHLEWHQKKHELILNLGLTHKNTEVADQTPTPTRFIRNCEEVGLFQDLQNINPFDELFKKATSSVTVDLVKDDPDSDDTLHTPRILPHIVDITSIKTEKCDSDCETFDFPILDTNVSEVKKLPIKSTKLSDSITVKTPNTNNNNKKSTRKKVVTTKPTTGKDNPVINVVPIKNLSSTKKCNNEELKRARESNRAAQLRCRLKKKQRWRRMEEEIDKLKTENALLKNEVSLLLQQLNKCQQNTTTTTNTTSPPIFIQVFPNTQLSFPQNTSFKKIMCKKS